MSARGVIFRGGHHRYPAQVVARPKRGVSAINLAKLGPPAGFEPRVRDRRALCATVEKVREAQRGDHY